MLSTIATNIKDLALSADGKEAKFVLVTKHSGEIGVTVPAECLKAFRLVEGGVSGPAPPVAPAPAAATQPTDNRNAQAALEANAQATIDANAQAIGEQKSGTTADQKPAVTITVPKKWYVGAEADKRLVIVVLDPMTPGQSGFALYPKAAMELAGALVKKAETMPAPGPAGASA